MSRFDLSAATAASILFLGMATAAVVGYRSLQARKAMDLAEGYMRAGFPALAAAELREARHELVHTPRGCALACDAFLAVGDMPLLRWTTEACLFEVFDLPSVHLARATILEREGNLQEAAEILERASKRLPGAPELRRKLETLYLAAGKR
jgi:hypothetical protein